MERDPWHKTGRWIWGIACLIIAGIAFVWGGLPLVALLAAALIAYAILFAAGRAAIFALKGRNRADDAVSFLRRFAADIRRAIFDGPFFILMYW
jgi:hypothetical protein